MPIYKINKGFIVQKLDDKTVIFDGEESILYTFNESSSYIFSKLKTGTKNADIINLMVKRYNITPSRANKDFQDFTAELLKKKIITQKTE